MSRENCGRLIKSVVSVIVGISIALQPMLVFACLPPKPDAPKEDHLVAGLFALFSVVLTLGCFLTSLVVPRVRQRVGWTGILALAGACVIHPLPWIIGFNIACGAYAREASIVFIPVSPGLIGIILYRRRKLVIITNFK